MEPLRGEHAAGEATAIVAKITLKCTGQNT